MRYSTPKQHGLRCRICTLAFDQESTDFGIAETKNEYEL